MLGIGFRDFLLMTLVDLENALWGYHQNNSIKAHFAAMQLRAWGGKTKGSDIYINPFDDDPRKLDTSTEEGRKEVEQKIKELF